MEQKDISYWTFRSFPMCGFFTFVSTLPDCKYERSIDYGDSYSRLLWNECECGKCDEDILIMDKESKERFYELIKKLKETYGF